MNMNVVSLVRTIKTDARCISNPPETLIPQLATIMPQDWIEFYTLLDGFSIDFDGSGRQWRVLKQSEVMQSDLHYFCGWQGRNEYLEMGVARAETISWWTIAASPFSGSDLISIETEGIHKGRATFASHEMHCLTYKDYVVANSFSQFINRLLFTQNQKAHEPYWELPGFPRLSAYA